MTDWTLRRAEPRDAKAFGQCLEAAYADYAGRLAGLPSMSEGLDAEIAEHLVWLAEADGRTLGALVLIEGDGYMGLANVAVHPDARGQGLGRRLLRLAEGEAAGRGYPELRLTTHVEMAETIALYERNGWRRTSREANKIRMTKSLAG
ncbi:MAG: GNAT family N-acetyltransferase [Pseudomonadota bacterium]